MPMLIDGEWQHVERGTVDGRFVRQVSRFRDWVTADPTSEFPAAVGRYHVYASLACPWAHRVLIFRKLKRLEHAISVSIVDPLMLEDGWTFSAERPDPLHGRACLHELYTMADPTFTGRVTVPVLWDTHTDRIVNNESSELIRMLNTAFDAFTDARHDYYPEPLRAEIDAVNARVYATLNNGVYRAGFASTQAAYDEAVTELFDTMDWLEARLGAAPYLVGGVQTEADWRLFTTLTRFDAVYTTHFKCAQRRLVDYPNLHAYTRRLFAVDGVAETFDFDYIKLHYFGSHRALNPRGIVPVGPDPRLT